jgi:hypothetical protein
MFAPVATTDLQVVGCEVPLMKYYLVLEIDGPNDPSAQPTVVTKLKEIERSRHLLAKAADYLVASWVNKWTGFDIQDYKIVDETQTVKVQQMEQL